jgi:hypothetical protein
MNFFSQQRERRKEEKENVKMISFNVKHNLRDYDSTAIAHTMEQKKKICHNNNNDKKKSKSENNSIIK